MHSNIVGYTVVVPSFNQGHYIDDTLNSLLNQNYPNLEILVMDGGSTDDTVDRLKSYGEKIRWVSEADGGQSAAISKGFAMASRPWITWLNSDDIQCNRALWKVSEVIVNTPGVDVVVGQGHYMDADGSNHRPYPTIRCGEGVDVRKEIFQKGYLAQPSVFFRKDVYDKIGGINQKLQFCMDYELWVRFALAGSQFESCDTDISGNRWYETTKTAGQLIDLLSEVTATQVKLFGKVSPYFTQAVSDNLYAKFHAPHFGDDHHHIYRWIYFKTVWIWLNARRPLYCIRGLLFETIAKSGPIIGDHLTYGEIFRALFRATKRKLFQ